MAGLYETVHAWCKKPFLQGKCKHFRHPVPNQRPNAEQIKEFNLFKCDACQKWYSAL